MICSRHAALSGSIADDNAKGYYVDKACPLILTSILFLFSSVCMVGSDVKENLRTSKKRTPDSPCKGERRQELMGTTPVGLQIGATEISDRTTGNELKVNTDGSINTIGQILTVGAAVGTQFSAFAVGANNYNGVGLTAIGLWLFTGGTWDRQYTPNVFKTLAAVAVTAATPQTVWTPAGGKKFRLMGYALSLSVAGAVILKDNTTEMIRTPLMAAGVGQSAPPMGNGIPSAVADQTLKVDVTVTGTVSGFVYGVEE